MTNSSESQQTPGAQAPNSPSSEETAALVALLARTKLTRRPRGSGADGRQSPGALPGHDRHHDKAEARHDRAESTGDDTRGTRGRHPRHGGPALMRMLAALADSPEPLTVSEIAEHIGVDQPRASRLVQQAVAHEQVAREADPADARRTRVALAAAGREAVERVRASQRAEAAVALGALTSAERSTLIALLGKLADAWPRH